MSTTLPPAVSAPTAENSSVASVVRRVARSGVWSTIGYVVSGGSGFAVAVIAGRALGPSGFGTFSYYFWATRLAATILAVGIPALLSRFISESLGRSNLGRARGVLRASMRANLVLMPVAAGVIAVFVLWRERSASLAAVLALSTAVTLLALQLEGFLSGLRQFRILARVAALGGAAQVGLVLLALATNMGWRGYMVMLGAASMVPAGASWIASRRATRGWPVEPLPRAELGRMARFAGIMCIVTLANEIVWGRPELFFLQHFRGSAHVGLYSAGLRLSAVIVILPALATRVLLPEFSWLRGGGREVEMQAAYRAVCRYVAAIGVPLAVGGAAVADLLIRALYGPGYEGAATGAAILLAGSLAGGILGTVSAAVFAGPRARIVAQVGAFIVALNLVLDVVLISRFGIVGAAAATAVSQVIGASIGLWYSIARLGLPYPGADALRLIACALVSAGAARIAALPFGGVPALAAAVAAGAVVYIGLVLALRIVTTGEVAAVLRRGPQRIPEAGA